MTAPTLYKLAQDLRQMQISANVSKRAEHRHRMQRHRGVHQTQLASLDFGVVEYVVKDRHQRRSRRCRAHA